MTYVGDVSGKRIQRRYSLLVGNRVTPQKTHSGIVRSVGRKAPRLPTAEVGHDRFVSHPACLRIIGRNVNSRNSSSGAAACGDLRRWLLLKPLQSTLLIRWLISRAPCCDKRREHAIRLRRPVGRVVGGTSRGKRDAKEMFDLKDEGHFLRFDLVSFAALAFQRLLLTFLHDVNEFVLRGQADRLRGQFEPCISRSAQRLGVNGRCGPTVDIELCGAAISMHQLEGRAPLADEVAPRTQGITSCILLSQRD